MKREGASGGGGSLSGISTSPAPSSEEYYKRSETKKWVLYAADWITVIIVTVISQLILIPWPLSNNFIASNPDIQQIHHDDDYGIDRISVVLSTAVPTVIIILWLGLLYRPLNELHRSILGLAMALSFCALFTSIFRQMSSILSSDFISLCRPTQEAYLRSVRFGTPISFDDCTNHDIKGSLHDYPMASITSRYLKGACRLSVVVREHSAGSSPTSSGYAPIEMCNS
ncbi:hypothetical protein GGI25_003711 [Coemansia spiralis]|uniref:Uncharacterized protein n=2 Tax=Coemansia TaxID=4863 RepID=A0A9W8G841_9FUNG|nr:hypothetical protein BX070DRAFT_252197 [Coemansia spiralis]KAJ1991955.1 hypothetical protein EDC05_003109 [Coemansia umbellata]KAJ2676205.1 hypothetical protein GGI25_003711 [Coemansia spiralis]